LIDDDLKKPAKAGFFINATRLYESAKNIFCPFIFNGIIKSC